MIGSTTRRCRYITKTLTLAAFVAASATPVLAQGKKLERELTFVRSLARDMRLVSLAQSQLAQLETEFKSAADMDGIHQLRVELSLVAARLNNNRAEQRTAYLAAIDSSKALLERSGDAAVQREARATLASAAQEFGQFLNEELEIARAEAPDQVKELETNAADVFRTGVECCDRVMQELRAERKSDAEKGLQYGLAWMRKGVLLREHGRAVKDDRAHLVEKAIGELEEMVLDYSEGSALGLRGLFELAQCHEVLGKLRDAIDGYQTTIEQIAFTLNEGVGADTGSFLFDMQQEVFAYLSELLLQQGNQAALGTLFQSFRDNLKKFGEAGLDPLDVCHPRFGHLTFLTECRFLAESGDAKKVQQALQSVQLINERHPSDFVGIKAKATLRELLRAQASLVSSDLLLEIAKGEFQGKNYEEAIKGLRNAIAHMTAEEKQKLGLEAYDLLGRSFRLSDRCLEAVIAFSTGLKQYGKQADGSESALASDIADRLDNAVAALKNITKSDPGLQPVIAMAEPLMLEYSTGGVGKIHYKNGTDRWSERKYAESAAAYAQVPVDFLNYEIARARIAKCFMVLGDFAKAAQAISDYRAWLGGKEAVLDPKRSDKAQVRQIAIQEMDYVEAFIAYIQAYGDSSIKVAKDLAKYPRAIELMRGFLTTYGKGGSSNEPSIVSAIDALGRMHADLNELEKAEESYIQLKEKDAARASKLASVIFATYQAHIDNLQKELDAAFASDNRATVERLRGELRKVRTRLATLGADYIKNSPEPQLAILVSTMNAYDRLEEWKQVEAAAQKAIDLFGNDQTPAVKAVIDQVVRIRIGEALLQQRKFSEALAMLQIAEAANPTHYELKRLICRALGGWYYFTKAGRGEKELGLGRFKEAYDKYVTEYGPWAKRAEVQKYSLEWYRFQWESYWFARQAGEKDSTYKGYADSIYRVTGALDSFAGLKALGEAGDELFQFFSQTR